MVHSTINCLITDRTGSVWSLQKTVKELRRGSQGSQWIWLKERSVLVGGKNMKVDRFCG